MKIICIVGSPRKKGNSQGVIDFIDKHPQRNMFSIETVWLCDHKIKPCNSCYQCFDFGKCAINDDVEDIVYKMIHSDAIIYVPVVYAFSTNSTFQSFMERAGFGYLSPMKRPLRNKLANVIVIGRRYSHTQVLSQIYLNIYLNEMIVIGSGFPSTVFCYGNFPGDFDMDNEGKKAITESISRMIEFHNKIYQPKRIKVYDFND